MRKILIALYASGLSGGAAHAAACAANFCVSGAPMMTAMSDRTWQKFPCVSPAAALKRHAQAVAAEGFSGIKVNSELAAIDAFQETSGSGRIQTLRVTARKSRSGARVDAVFNIQVGQVTSESVVRGGLCKVVSAAAP